jgi:prepilin-type N-terminal cleavage/methylation domain-containing protein
MDKLRLNKKGFTLIELLIVVIVIGVLSGLVISVINSGGFRSKARDSQRIADLKIIQTALELYFADNRNYPASGWIQINGTDALSGALESGYINSVPVDPLHSGSNNGPCEDPAVYRYNYRTESSTLGDNYVITAYMEIDSSNDGHEYSTINNFINGTITHGCSFDDATEKPFLYVVENP